MPRYLLLLILLTCPLARQAEGVRAPARPSDAVEVFHCGFDEAWDVNYDGWPDRWRRAEGPDYPRYVEMEIDDAAGASSGRALVIRLDGSRAEASSPPIRVSPRFAYKIEAQVRVERVQHTAVRFRIDFQNAEGQTLQSEMSEPIAEGAEWQRIKLDTLRTLHPEVTQAVARITADPGRRGDLEGEVALGDVWVARMPSMKVTTNNVYNVYQDPREVLVTCTMSGIRERDPDIRFQLLDATDREIGEQGEKHMDGKLIVEESFKGSTIASGFEGSTDWEPKITEPGFYRVRVEMISSITGELMDERKVSLAVLPKLSAPAQSEFGWSLDEIDWSPMPLRPALAAGSLQSLLPEVGIGWMKLPVWFPADQSALGDRIVHFVEQLAAHDIEAVGLLMSPQSGDARAQPTPVGQMLGGDPSEWLPMWDHVMTRLSLRVRWWQLGGEYDVSLMGEDDTLAKRVELIRTQLFRFGQDVRLGIGWRWAQPTSKSPVWEFQQMCSGHALQEFELEQRLVTATPTTVNRWVLIEPLSEDADLPTEVERHQERVRRFVHQMVTAKMHGARGVFVAKPFSGPRGLMERDGTPGELLLPWRTTARLLGGAEYLGRMQLPGGSENRLFRRKNGQVVMVLWNENPTTETLYLGEAIERFDIWGRPVPVADGDGEQTVSASRMPTFVVGLNDAVARWRMAIELADDHIPSVFTHVHPNQISLTNTFRPGVGTVSGTFSFFVPDALAESRSGQPAASNEWDIYVPSAELRMPAGATVSVPIEISLKEASYGPQRVRIDFDINADRRYVFSAWRTLHVGRADVRFDIHTFLDPKGRLMVVQKMVNDGGGAAPNFKCMLYTWGRRRQRQQVFQLGPAGDEKHYSYEDGQELIGQVMKLRLEETDGERTLIHRFQATAGPPPQAADEPAPRAQADAAVARPFTPEG
ncbi:hypothetical protein Pla175_50140 [Pirellulimonas nuda]|uniref:Uncharacterized protein n=1 Tax=Pirellulimonas nuda TaxID=2528009 RepID=A0A518DJC2_9BACT|nr:hypothetical protein [Pirellulimonas nuda]QDU91584.1 hypothetical protein Pla175_50140 [Pirellulimonas nuda]